jgi:hypothetical protein
VDEDVTVESSHGGRRFTIRAGDRTYHATDWGCIEYRRGDSPVYLQVTGDSVRAWVRWMVWRRYQKRLPVFATNADAAVAALTKEGVGR